jgi:hypothetical protein
VLQDRRHVVAGRRHIGVGEQDRDPLLRAVDQPHLRPEDGAQRPLAADEGAGDVEALLGQEVVEVVARDPARDLGVALADQVGVAVTEVAEPRVDLAAAPALGHDALELFFARRTNP